MTPEQPPFASPKDLEFLSKVAAYWKSKEPQPESAVQFGRFVVQETLGQGGFGIVYRAFDPLLGRDVAIKVPGLQSLADESRLKRFLAEARHLGALSHPNLAELYEANEVDGLCYIAMKYYPEGTLANWLNAQKTAMPADQIARIFEGIVSGVAAAHTVGLVHRDLKPSNILLALNASEIVPCVADFGLAKIIGTDDQSYSLAGVVRMGTTDYMAPEKFADQPVSTQAGDVFALGVMLFELWVGRKPILYHSIAQASNNGPNKGQVSEAALEQVLQNELENLRSARPDAPPTWIRIVGKCLKFNASERYQDASELLAELQSEPSSMPTRLAPVKSGAKSVIYAMSAIALLGLVVWGINGSWGGNDQSLKPATPISSLSLETKSNLSEDRYAYSLEIQAAFARSKSDSSHVRQQTVRRALSRLQTQTVPFEAAYLNSLSNATREFTLNFGKAHGIPHAAVSADARWLAVIGMMRDVLLFDLELPHSVRRYQGLQDNFFRVAISPGNKYVVGVTSIYKRPDRTAPQVLLWDFETSKLLLDLNDHIDLVNIITCEFLSDDQLLLSGSFREGDRVKIFSIEKLLVEQSISNSKSNSTSNSTSNSSPPLELGLAEENLRFQVLITMRPDIDSPKIFVIDKLNQRTSSFQLKHDAAAIDLSNNGLLAIVNSNIDPSNIGDSQTDRVDSEIVVWDPQSQAELFREVRKEANSITAVTFAPDEKSIFIIDMQGMVHQRSLEKHTLECLSDGLAPKETWCVSIHPSDPKILYCGDSGWVGLHSIQASQASQVTQAIDQQASGTTRWQLHGDLLVTQCAWRPGHRDQFATSSFDGNVRLWQLTGDTPQMLAEFPHPGRVRCIAFNADGTRIATGCEDQKIRIFDTNSLKQISTLAEHTGKVRSLAYTSDGRTLLSSANDASIITWDLSTSELSKSDLSTSDLSTLDLSTGKPTNTEHLSAISICSAVSPNGKWFVFGTEAGVLGIRSLTSGGESKDIPVAKQWLRCVAISSDSQTLATGTQDGEIALWNLETGIKLADFSKQSSPIMSLSFSSDNRTLTAGLYSGQLVVWNVN